MTWTLPDVELVTVLWLQTIDGIADIGADVFTSLPHDPTPPLLRVLRVGGATEARGWLDVARVQIDAWADDKETAHTLARAAQIAMRGMPGSHDHGVVTGVDDGVFRWNPDPDYGWPGYTADYLVYLHPNPGDAGS